MFPRAEVTGVPVFSLNGHGFGLCNISWMTAEYVALFAQLRHIFTATCFSNVAVMGSLDVRPSVCLSVRNVGEQ